MSWRSGGYWVGLLVAGLLAILPFQSARAAQPRLTILAYHDVVDARTAGTDNDAVTTQELSQHLQWLRSEGYRFVRAQDVLDHHAGRSKLPARAVLLTFDDGYRSFYTHALPLLQTVQAPALLAVVGAWLTPDASGHVQVDGTPAPASRFLTREQLRSIAASGLVEVASHTHSLHRAVLASPQGSRVPAVIAREYNDARGTYESDEDYTRRLEGDLEANSRLIAGITGTRPRLLVWPYGRYNGRALAAASRTGHVATFGLEEAPVGSADPGLPIGRRYIVGEMGLRTFASLVRAAPGNWRSHRHLAVSLDAAPGQEMSDEERVSALVDTVRRSGANTVLLRPFSRECKAFFAGRRPVERDLLTRTVWQLHKRAAVQVFLDLDVAGCVSGSDAASEVRSMSQLAALDGLVLRVHQGYESLALSLSDVFLAEHPGRAIVSNADISGRTHLLKTVDACREPGTTADTAPGAARNAKPALWVEGVTGDCASLDRLESEVHDGAASWGVRFDSASQLVAAFGVASTSWLERQIRPLLSGLTSQRP